MSRSARSGHRARLLIVGAVCLAAGAVLISWLGPNATSKDVGTPSTTPDVTAVPSGRSPTRPAKNVIFVNGDGMSAAQREAGRLRWAGLDGKLQMDQLRVSGSLTTDSRDPDTFVTDSAAGASAWSTGQKIYNGAISVDLQGKPLAILGALAKKSGKATGLVTSAQVTDATPAAFFAQTPDRARQSEIARQSLEESKPDVILGGGEDWWYPRGSAGRYRDHPPIDPSEASKGTEGNLVREAQQLGYSYVSTPAQLAATKGTKVLGLFANEEMFEQRAEGDGDRYVPVVPLATMATKALNLLSADPQGFFLLIEEEGIDEFAHDNNGRQMLLAIQQLDAAVAVARRYVAQHSDTLLVITGDHETGGLVVEENSGKDESGTGASAEDGPFPIKDSSLTFTMDWTTNTHSDNPVPVSAEGPGASSFTGQHPNTFVHTVLTKSLG